MLARAGRAWPWATARWARRWAPRPTATPTAGRPRGRRRGARRRCRSGPRRSTAGGPARPAASGSVAVPTTGPGRLWGTSATRAPSVRTSGTPSSSARPTTWRAERAPPELGLGADEQEHVVGVARAGWRRRPRWRARRCGGRRRRRAGLRARRGEVEELLGVDLGDQLGVAAVDQVADGAAGGVAGVVPSLERGDEHGSVERRAGSPPDVLHRAMLAPPSAAPAASPVRRPAEPRGPASGAAPWRRPAARPRVGWSGATEHAAPRPGPGSTRRAKPGAFVRGAAPATR